VHHIRLQVYYCKADYLPVTHFVYFVQKCLEEECNWTQAWSSVALALHWECHWNFLFTVYVQQWGWLFSCSKLLKSS
jgi:hypothetical protein